MADTQASISPQLTSARSSPLDALAMRALARFGEMSPTTVEGAMGLFLDYGNEIIDDILSHPYCPEGSALPYYISVTETRDIPDHIVVAGLLFRHALQQKSKAATRYESDYYAKLNQIMLRVKFGTGASFNLLAVDYPA